MKKAQSNALNAFVVSVIFLVITCSDFYIYTKVIESACKIELIDFETNSKDLGMEVKSNDVKNNSNKEDFEKTGCRFKIDFLIVIEKYTI